LNNNEYRISDAINVIEEVLNSGGEFTLSPKGISMLPIIKEGRDVLIIKSTAQKSIKKKDILFYKRNDGSYVIHRVLKVCKDGTYTLNGDNQLFLESGIMPDQIIGYVCEIYRNEKPIIKTAIYKLYLLFWCNMPLRKLIFGVRGVVHKIKSKN